MPTAEVRRHLGITRSLADLAPPDDLYRAVWDVNCPSIYAFHIAMSRLQDRDAGSVRFFSVVIRSHTIPGYGDRPENREVSVRRISLGLTYFLGADLSSRLSRARLAFQAWTEIFLAKLIADAERLTAAGIEFGRPISLAELFRLSEAIGRAKLAIRRAITWVELGPLALIRTSCAGGQTGLFAPLN